MKNICIFCSSSDAVSNTYFTSAKNLAEKLIINDFSVVYGGSNVGLMRQIAETVVNNSGQISGVIPRKIKDKNLHYKNLTKLIVTKDLRERKSKLDEFSDAFIVLPGGFGTLDELFETITHKQLAYHHKPIIIFNINGYYNKLLAFFEQMYKENFAKEFYKNLYHVTENIDDVIEYLKNYKTSEFENKWFETKFKNS